MLVNRGVGLYNLTVKTPSLHRGHPHHHRTPVLRPLSPLLGDLVVGGGEGDLESFGFADPAFALGFADAGEEVVADALQSAALSRQVHIRDIDITGELPLDARRQLKESLAALLPGDDRALTFNGVLGLACAKQAWPVWQTAFPTESRPMDLAQAAVSMITEKRTSGSPWVSSEFVKVKTYLDDKFLLGREYFPAIYAGFAAWSVARHILFWDHAKAVRGDTELDIDPDDWDAYFYASAAVTGGATWENIGQPDMRREFWSWYLTTAVPESFTMAIER